MEWFSADNVIAVLTALLGVAASAAMLWYERHALHRLSIGHRVQLDTAVNSSPVQGSTDAPPSQWFANSDAGDPTLVLLRIENDGREAIVPAMYSTLDQDGQTNIGLAVEFTGREVQAVSVTAPVAAPVTNGRRTPADDPDAPPPNTLLGQFRNLPVRHAGTTLYVPRVQLNPGQHFKLLVLLRGGSAGGRIEVRGQLTGGDISETKSLTIDDKPPLFSRTARYLTIALTACVVTLASLIVVRGDDPPPIGCATGTLTVTGSTSFAPVAEELARKYEDDCPGSTVKVEAHGSTAGVRALDEAGAEAEGGSPALIALSDGPKPGGYPQLRETATAVSAFALVVNDRVPVKNLTLAQVRGIYSGKIRNWRELGGPVLPITLVSRDANSGTREVFQRQVLHRNEPANSSRDCEHKDDPSAPVIRCELDSTDQVLQTVARLPGALGYSELRTGSPTKGLHSLRLDGHVPSLQGKGAAAYPFQEIEYAYTFGHPPADSLVSSFLDYMSRGSGQDVMLTHGHIPCATPKGLRLCGEE
ncbi:substrate-binding domain-containing protein [Streptomyces sp. T-3]|nr:substrate-binding domain-containing protein [Streptomyces sp. T-3]